MQDYLDVIRTNQERIAVINAPYNPVTGEGACGKRKKVRFKDSPIEEIYLPESMIKENTFVRRLIRYGLKGYVKKFHDGDPEFEELIWIEFIKVRIIYDFEYWLYSFIQIRDKKTGYMIPFLPNRAQRKVLAILERMRLAGMPIKFILLKARQWGGSTLVQFYMLWIQLVHRTGWNSVICGDVESQSRNVRAMITNAMKDYPEYLLGEKVRFVPYEGSSKNRIIENTGCVVSIGSAQKPDTLRSGNISGAHLTEVGLWRATEEKTPEDLVQSIEGSILDGAYSFFGLESTAKGVGNYFHRKWVGACDGSNNLCPIFVAWFEIDIYSKPIIKRPSKRSEEEQYKEFIQSMTEYEWVLWELGATLEAINWYRWKSGDMNNQWRMNSEFPSTPNEAFQSTGNRRFRMSDTIRLRSTCIAPSFVGEIVGQAESGKDAATGLKLEKNDTGYLSIWRMPDKLAPMENRYVVSMDVGGSSDNADYTDIVVFDRYWMSDMGVPEVVAEWHGHADHDIAAWKAVQLCMMYGNNEPRSAHLVIESNTLETEGTEGDNSEYILDEIVGFYPNLYSRTSPEQIKQGAPTRYGFHTNVATKSMIISHVVKCMRQDLYIERCNEAVDEYDVYEIKPNGKEMGAVEGMHDDRVMSRAIGLYVCYHIDLPNQITQLKVKKRKIVSEATI